MAATTDKTAILYRMVMPRHLCPWGLRAKHLLTSRGFTVEDRHLRSREEIDAFKTEQGVATTPQVFIEGVRIGGHDDLRRHFGLKLRDPKALSYTPIWVVFGTAALLGMAMSQAMFGTPLTIRAAEWFVSVGMVLLAMLKLRDVDSFATMFLGYDLLAQRWLPYGYVYPFAELLAGLLMTAGVLPWLSIPLALVIGLIGAVSVFKAVYVDKRALKCACVGGDSNVPLGFVSLTENLVMIAMAAWLSASSGILA